MAVALRLDRWPTNQEDVGSNPACGFLSSLLFIYQSPLPCGAPSLLLMVKSNNGFAAAQLGACEKQA